MVRGLLADLQADLNDYHELEGRLEAQFQAMLRHDGPQLAEAGAAVATLVSGLAQRGQRRQQLLRKLLAGRRLPGMRGLFQLLPDSGRIHAERGWSELEKRVQHCQGLNRRNGELLAAQHDIMQRVLHGERDTYVPD